MSPRFFAKGLLVAICLSVVSSAYGATSALDKHLEVGKTYLVNQDYGMAIREFDAALKLAPRNAEVLVERGSAYNELKQYDKAIKDFSQAIAISPNSYLAFNNRGVANFRKGDLANAIKDLDRAIEIDPNQAFAYLNRAGASLCGGDKLASAEKLAAWLRKGNWEDRYGGHAAVLAVLSYKFVKSEAAAKTLIAESLKKVDRLKWPYPFLKYLNGTMTVKEVMEESEHSDYDTTQAHCFLALDQIIKRQDKLADTNLDWVIRHGVRDGVEYWIATGLKRTRVKPQTGK